MAQTLLFTCEQRRKWCRAKDGVINKRAKWLIYVRLDIKDTMQDSKHFTISKIGDINF